MSRLQTIENALSSINETVFQELCDSFLVLRNSNYSAFSRTGSKSGKQKTVKGTPDTFLLLPNGKYIFVEYSTNVTKGINKLEEDIRKCTNTEKTGIQLNQIAEIIICINFNLTTIETESLQNILKGKRIPLTIFTQDSLALELYLNHRDLAHEYLGLPLDTGQIVSIDRFITEYNKAAKGISTPLDNTFLHREPELIELKQILHSNDFIILTGAPGIGKTKLALEGIKSFQSENLSFGSYCISYKNHTLLDDLYQYINTEKDYILFVDDANRIDAFNQIVGFFKAPRKGKLKILITVRDYAFQEIGILCQEFSPRHFSLTKFSDEQIIDIIKAKPFDILNPDYHKEIVRIADGNPRLSIMTALLAKAEQNIYALHDVSDLFEKYFSTFIRDDGEFAKVLNLKCLGLISFFYTIPYKNKQISTSILEKFDIEYSEFIDTIDKLDKLELVEIRFDHVKIPEQNLSTYFFYKTFIKEIYLDFTTLLTHYFENNKFRFRDTVIPAYNMMGGLQIEKQLKPKLQSHWKSIKNKADEAYEYLDIFWYLLMEETLEFVYEIVESLPDKSTEDYEAIKENNPSASDNLLKLISEFFRFPLKLNDAIELAFEYTRKRPECFAELINKIREQMTFDIDDESYGFARQNTLYQILIDGLTKGEVHFTAAFYELSKTFLSFKFQHTKGGRNDTFYWYFYPIPNIPDIQTFRKRIWDNISSNFKTYPSESFELLQKYAKADPDVLKEIMEFDIPLLIEIIENELTPDSYEHCRYVQEQISWCKRNSISHPSFQALTAKFRNSLYEISLKLDWDRFRDKEFYEFDNFREYDKLKEADIRNSFVFTSKDQVNEFYNNYFYLKSASKNPWSYNTALDLIIDQNCAKNFEIGCDLLSVLIENNNEVNYNPRAVFWNNLQKKDTADKIWNILQRREFNGKSFWELSFYEQLDDSLVDKQYVEALLNTVKKMNDECTIFFDRLKKFTRIEPTLDKLLLEIIVYKNEEEKTRLQIWMDFFSENFDQLGYDIELVKKAYLQQESIQNHFDYERKGFLNILTKDRGFLLQYVTNQHTTNKSISSHKDENLSFIWQIDNIENELTEVFDFTVEHELYYGIREYFCNSFFRNLSPNVKNRAKNYLIKYCKANYQNANKMNLVIDIVRVSIKELFEEILLLFLSLNQDRDIFSQIYWRGNGTSGTGKVILADIEAADWRNILSIVEKSSIGLKLLPIKNYLRGKIDHCLKMADLERQTRFLQEY